MFGRSEGSDGEFLHYECSIEYLINTVKPCCDSFDMDEFKDALVHLNIHSLVVDYILDKCYNLYIKILVA